jgi:hypothetical protein
MNLATRRAALRAASRLALGALSFGGAAGCGGQVASDELGHPKTQAEPPRAEDNPPAAATGEPPPEQVAHDAGPPQTGMSTADPPLEPADAGPELACSPAVELAPPPRAPGAATIDDGEFACCLAHVERQWLADAAPPAESDDSFWNCCRVVLAGVDEDPLRYSQVGAARDCCYHAEILGLDQDALWSYSLCTPWGPPVPPGMDWNAGAVA